MPRARPGLFSLQATGKIGGHRRRHRPAAPKPPEEVPQLMDWQTYPPAMYITSSAYVRSDSHNLFSRFYQPAPLTAQGLHLYCNVLYNAGPIEVAAYLDDGAYQLLTATAQLTAQGLLTFTVPGGYELPAGWLYFAIKARDAVVYGSFNAFSFFAQQLFQDGGPAVSRRWLGFLASTPAAPLPATFDPSTLLPAAACPVARLGP